MSFTYKDVLVFLPLLAQLNPNRTVCREQAAFLIELFGILLLAELV